MHSSRTTFRLYATIKSNNCLKSNKNFQKIIFEFCVMKKNYWWFMIGQAELSCSLENRSL